MTIAAGAPSVAISGAPASMVAGTSAQLRATVWASRAACAWSATAGSVVARRALPRPRQGPRPAARRSCGRPARPTPRWRPRCRIRDHGGPEGHGQARPLAAAERGPRLLSPLKARFIGPRTLVAKVATGRKGGRVSITASARGKVLGRCRARVGARRGFVCRVTLKGASPPARVRLTATLTLRSGVTVVRRALARR